MSSRFHNLSLGIKVSLSPVILILVLLGSGGFSVYTAQSVDAEVRRITDDLAGDADLAANVLADILQQRLTLKSYLQTSEEGFVRAFRDEESSSRAGLAKARGSITHPRRASLVSEIETLHQDYSALFEDGVINNMARRHQLVGEVLDVKGPAMEDGLSQIMQTARRDDDIEAGYQAGVAQRHLLLARLYVYKYLMSNAASARQRVEQELKILRGELDEMHELLQNPQRRGLADEVQGLLSDYRQGFAAVVAAIEARNLAVERMDAIGPQIAAKAEALQDSVAGSMAEQSAQVHAEMRRNESLTLTFTLLALVLGGVITWAVSRAILGPLQATIRALGAIAEGDLTGRLTPAGGDELGQLARSFNGFVERLQATLGKVQSSVGCLASASEELSTVTKENRRTIDRQLLETEQVATAVEEMSATLQDVTHSVHETARAADEAHGAAVQGREVEGQALDSIHALGSNIDHTAEVIEAVGQASETVDTVVEVIKSIAEQTNLLALNAAIESARAGEQGRGFAVVADEVRTLAGRTRESTEEIRQTVEQLRNRTRHAVERMNESRDQTQHVVDQARQVDQALEGIAGRVRTIDTMTAQIATATEEQTAVAGEVAHSVVNLKDQAGHVATATEQLNGAASELARMADGLQVQLSAFRVETE